MIDTVLEKATRASEAQIRKKQMPALLSESYDRKIVRSNALVTEFEQTLGLDEIYVSTSGGKDSAVLSRLCKSLFPTIKHVMFDTGLEYQATIELAKSQGAEIVPPRTSWVKFCESKGYPVGSKQVSKRIHDARISPIGCALTMFSRVYHLSDKWLHFLETDIPISHKCCDEFKKKPAKSLKLNPIIGTRIQESEQRKSAWKKSGCNSYSLDYKHGVSRPLSLWQDGDIEKYVRDENVKLSRLYTQYEAKRTGCVNCPYGAQLDGSRFDLLKELEPKRYDYFMKTKLRYILLLSGVEIVTDPEYMAELQSVSQEVQEWHEAHKGTDKYLSWKVRWSVERHGKEEMKKAVDHIKANLLYDYEKIMEEIEKC